VDVIVGLGNPGPQYQWTRHNIGFAVLDVLASRHHISIQQREAESLCGPGRIGGRAVLLVKPQTYMNASGRAVAPLVQHYLQTGEQLVVIHDEIDLPLGRIKLKRQGGDAGHRGIRSIIASLEHDVFVRVRMGIGRPLQKADIVDYVLSPFLPEEAVAHDAMIVQAVTCIERLLQTAEHA
jgi:peptidyl-tRNA hydrolase, PTH1 family